MQAMNMSIAQVSAFPPTGERHQRSAAEASPAPRSAATASNDATRRDNSPREIPTANKITFDDAGFTVVRTIDVDTGDVVAQNPTEAYLRLAHAMIDAVRIEAADRSSTDVFA